MSEVPLKEYLEARVSSLEDKLALHISYGREAIDLARRIIDKRMEEANFVRDQLREQAATLVARESFDVTMRASSERMDRMLDRIILLEKEAANIQGRFWALGVAFAVISVFVQLLARYLWTK
jgi:hypothetical protein